MSATRTMDWTEEGRRIGVTLDAFHAVIVVGVDPVATAETALGIARVQAVHRRVAVGDLLGEAPPLQSLVADKARELASQIRVGNENARVVTAVRDGSTIYRVVLGPYPTREEADRVGKESKQSYWIYEGGP